MQRQDQLRFFGSPTTQKLFARCQTLYEKQRKQVQVPTLENFQAAEKNFITIFNLVNKALAIETSPIAQKNQPQMCLRLVNDYVIVLCLQIQFLEAEKIEEKYQQIEEAYQIFFKKFLGAKGPEFWSDLFGQFCAILENDPSELAESLILRLLKQLGAKTVEIQLRVYCTMAGICLHLKLAPQFILKEAAEFYALHEKEADLSFYKQKLEELKEQAGKAQEEKSEKSPAVSESAGSEAKTVEQSLESKDQPKKQEKLGDFYCSPATVDLVVACQTIYHETTLLLEAPNNIKELNKAEKNCRLLLAHYDQILLKEKDATARAKQPLNYLRVLQIFSLVLLRKIELLPAKQAQKNQALEEAYCGFVKKCSKHLSEPEIRKEFFAQLLNFYKLSTGELAQKAQVLMRVISAYVGPSQVEKGLAYCHFGQDCLKEKLAAAPFFDAAAKLYGEFKPFGKKQGKWLELSRAIEEFEGQKRLRETAEAEKAARLLLKDAEDFAALREAKAEQSEKAAEVETQEAASAQTQAVPEAKLEAEPEKPSEQVVSETVEKEEEQAEEAAEEETQEAASAQSQASSSENRSRLSQHKNQKKKERKQRKKDREKAAEQEQAEARLEQRRAKKKARKAEKALERQRQEAAEQEKQAALLQEEKEEQQEPLQNNEEESSVDTTANSSESQEDQTEKEKLAQDNQGEEAGDEIEVEANSSESPSENEKLAQDKRGEEESDELEAEASSSQTAEEDAEEGEETPGEEDRPLADQSQEQKASLSAPLPLRQVVKDPIKRPSSAPAKFDTGLITSALLEAGANLEVKMEATLNAEASGQVEAKGNIFAEQQFAQAELEEVELVSGPILEATQQPVQTYAAQPQFQQPALNMPMNNMLPLIPPGYVMLVPVYGNNYPMMGQFYHPPVYPPQVDQTQGQGQQYQEDTSDGYDPNYGYPNYRGNW